jgi:hypothetical protein
MAPDQNISAASPEADGPTFSQAPHHLRGDFLKWVKQSAPPEKFWAVSSGRMSRSEPYTIIAEFDVERKKRPLGDEVACSICSPDKPKFLDGRFVFGYKSKRVYLIGHTCADDRVNAKAVKEYKGRFAALQARDFLHSVCEIVIEQEQYLTTLAGPVIGAGKWLHALKVDAKPVAALLASNCRTHGDFLVVEKETEADERRYETNDPRRFERLTSLAGTQRILLSRMNIERDFAVVTALSAALVEKCSTTSSIDRLSNKEAITAKKLVSRLDRAGKKLVEELQIVQRFFSTANMERLRQWSEHPRCPYRFRVRMSNEGVSIKDYHGIGSVIGRWPLLEKFVPEWPSI